MTLLTDLNMPLYLLKIKADLENVKQLVIKPDNEWMFHVKSMDEEIREGITFSRAKELEIEGSRGNY